MEGKNESKHTLSQEDREVIASQAEKAVNVAYDIDYPYEKMWVKGYQSGAEWGILHERDRLQTELSEIKKENERLKEKAQFNENEFFRVRDLNFEMKKEREELRSEVDRLTKEKSEAVECLEKTLRRLKQTQNMLYKRYANEAKLGDTEYAIDTQIEETVSFLTRIK